MKIQGKKKKATYYYLIEADNIDEAIARLHESLHYLLVPYVVMTVSCTNICDVFPYDLSEVFTPE